jgi:hypothetical protein
MDIHFLLGSLYGPVVNIEDQYIGNHMYRGQGLAKQCGGGWGLTACPLWYKEQI